MASISELAKLAPDMTTAQAVAALKAELAGETRKGAIQVILDSHLGAILDQATPPTPGSEAATAAAANRKPDHPLGTIYAHSGLLIVIDAAQIDEAWKHKTNAHGGYIVDMIGEQAEYLAHRQGSAYRVTSIPGGKRIHCLNIRQAQVVADQAKALSQRENWNMDITYFCADASYALALDAVRDAAGDVAIAVRQPQEFAVFKVTPGSRVQVREREGRVVVG